MWLPQHTDSSNLSRLGQRVQGTKVLKRGTFLFSFWFLWFCSVSWFRQVLTHMVSYSFLSPSWCTRIRCICLTPRSLYIYIYILRCALCFCEFCAFVYPTKRKEFSVLVFIQGCALSSWRKIGLFSESFHVITWSLVSFHDFFVWVLFILFFLSVLDKFLWICLYFFDGRWLCSLRCVNILVRRAVKFFWIILELVGKFWSLFKF
jgi:hypothetical protein